MYPTNDVNFKDNAEDYLSKNGDKLTTEKHNEIEQHISKILDIEVADIEKDENGNYSGVIIFEETENKFSIINDNFNVDYKAPKNALLNQRYNELKELILDEVSYQENELNKVNHKVKNQIER